MPKKKKYDNILAVPLSSIYLHKHTPQTEENYQIEIQKRETALFEEYDLVRPKNIPVAARELISKMARDLKIDGFYYEGELKTAGRPKKWATNNDKIILFLIIQRFKKKYPNKTLSNIINIVAKEYYPDMEARSLYTRYQEIEQSEEIKFVSTLLKRNNCPDDVLNWICKARKVQSAPKR